jgi:septal ring factor EnvC (AmiA/AmiB activator)
MSSRPLLEAGVLPQASAEEVPELHRRLKNANDRIDRLESELDDAKRRNASLSLGMAELRRQLEPLHNALKMLFGELDAAGVAGYAAADARGGSEGTWELWKRKLGGKQAAVIQALLEHGEMTAVQLKVATQSGYSTVSEVLSKLIGLGLVTKNGGRYSLKQLP